MMEENNKMMDFMEAVQLLKKYNINVVGSKYVESADDAVSFSNGDPIVMKVLSDKALHKTKSGVVKLDLSKPEDIKAAYDDLYSKAQELKPYKILAQKMIKGGTEIIIGGNTDPQFGKAVLLGFGGIYVETFKDVSLRVCPLTDYDAYSMIDSLKSKNIIAPDKESRDMVKGLIINVSKMLMENQNISELDLNPIILHDGTYDAVDLRFILGE
ncbi:acyl-CoA synthetase subunit beta [Candidatus Mancarchaeum acidiphilum]|uniref:Acyl-CoA synthetase subunit beta n=1 Tax=Candidatus Mancarchaeum acidiphilum TaxID=1920749 RepID=A0A218NP09_9ARCH|nr:acetate--CoA ligase family protein [Candidatus Mancarchaeum acidiphilum]ASI14201.1 acyl-CoA synthetase subunit beta [Candidatus Mancarchaeum acidiphilum]